MQHGFVPEDIYNFDETRYAMGLTATVASFHHNGRTAHVVYIFYHSLLPILSLNQAM
jgi:hypothetical protein